VPCFPVPTARVAVGFPLPVANRPPLSFYQHQQLKDLSIMAYWKPTLAPPKIEQFGEFKNTTRRGDEPRPPDAARALRGTQTIEGIREAAEARRRQSASWATRDVGPQNLANRNSKRK
jgi:hypothetical protein